MERNPTRRDSSRDLVILGFAVTLILLLADGVFGYVNIRRLAEHDRWVAHTHEVIAELENLLTTVQDAENGQRGYLLTEDEALLRTYDQALTELQHAVPHVRELTADNPAQQRRLVALGSAIEARIDELKRTVDMAKAGDRAGALAAVRSGPGRTMMDELRARVAEVRGAEEDLLFRRSAEARTSFSTAVSSIVLTTLMGVALVGAVFYLNQRIARARRRAAEQIGEQRELLRVTLASIGDGVITTDAEGRVTYMNSVAAMLTGWTVVEAAGRPLGTVFNIVNEKTRAPSPNPAEKVLKEGVVVGLANHTVLVRRDGTERPIDDSAAPITNEAGAIVGCVLIFRDVSARRRLERDNAERQEATRFLASIVESSGDAIVSKSLSGIIRTWNAAAERLFGYSAEEAVGKHISLIIPADRSGEEEQIIGRIRAGAGVDHFETVRVRKDGRMIPISLTVSPIKDEAGRVVGASKVARDITDRKDAEESIRSLNDQLAAELAGMTWMHGVSERMIRADDFSLLLDEVLSAAIGISGAQMGNIQLLETGALRIVSQRGFEEPFLDYFASVDNDRGACGAALRQGERTLIEDVATSDILDEPTRRVLLAAHVRAVQSTPLVGRAGEILGIVSTHYRIPHRPAERELRLLDLLARLAADIIEVKKAEEDLRISEDRLKDADRRKDEFLATLAHELRGPLAPLSNMLQIMKRAGGDPDLIERARGTMERQLGQLVRLVDDLIDVSRITRGTMELRKDDVELASVLHQVVEAARPLAESSQVDVGMTLPSDPVYLHADATRLAQIFGNILNNACKYTEPGGHIAILAAREDGDVVVKIKDSGMGIPEDKLASVFDMFTQVDRTLERSQGGLGIGLSLVKRLVEMHDGSVEVFSEGLERGSEFVVRLPALLQAPRAAPMAPHFTAATDTRRVLVADDNADTAASLAMLFKITGNEAHIARDGVAAVEAAERLRPDVILLDIGMPRLNGLDACRRIREKPWGKDIVIVALTGWGQEEDRQKTKDAGFDHHLVKPVDYDALMGLLTGPAR